VTHEVLDAHVTRKRRRNDSAAAPLRFMSPEQYRKEFGRDPVFPESKTEPWPDAGNWLGWTKPWRPPRVIVVMAEWTDAFLWNRSPDREPFADDYVLDPVTLEISPGLTQRLRSWNARFGGDANDPVENDEAWWDEGLALAQELQREFDGRDLAVEVLYHGRQGQELPVRDRPRRAHP
jgi:hypothetical protein